MSGINKQVRQEVHEEVNRILDRLEEIEQTLNARGESLSPDAIKHAFSGLSTHAALTIWSKKI